MIKRLRKKLGKGTGTAGAVTGGASVLSSYNVCHSICMVAVALLSMFGITASATFLLFLQPYSIIFWNIGLVFLIISLLLYLKFEKCISQKLIMFNVGLIIIAFPFFQEIFYLFWIAGFLISAYAAFLYFSGRNK